MKYGYLETGLRRQIGFSKYKIKLIVLHYCKKGKKTVKPA